MESKFKFGFDPAIEEKLAERQPMFPRLYELADMKFATLTEIPDDILRDMQYNANLVLRHTLVDERTKREAIKNIFDQGVERAMGRGYYNGDRVITTNKGPFIMAEEELRAGQIKMSDFLDCMKPYHSGGILAQIHEMDNELKKDEAELKLPKKHSTHINL